MSRHRSNRLQAAYGHAVGIEEAVNDFLLHHPAPAPISTMRVRTRARAAKSARSSNGSSASSSQNSGSNVNRYALERPTRLKAGIKVFTPGRDRADAPGSRQRERTRLGDTAVGRQSRT